MLITRRQLESLVPHAGPMVMIDGVTAWDEKCICCVSWRHLAADNPLRREGRLAAHHAIEFAAQAAAVHGGLLDGGRPGRLRALAAVRQARFSQPWLDELSGSLQIVASVAMLDQQAAIYQARLTHRDLEIVSMRLTLMTIEPENSSP